MTEAAPHDRRLLAIFLIVLIDVLGLTIILPLLPFYAERFGASAATVGAILSTYSACQLVAGPILGYWSDRVGRKRVLIVSQVGTCIGFLILAFAHSLLWIFVSRIIDGLTAGNLSTAQAYISDVAAPEHRARQLGRIGIAFAVGFFIGPALTAWLYRYGYHAPILAAATLSFTSIMASTFLLSNERPGAATSGVRGPEESILTKARRYFARQRLARLFMEIFLFYFSFSLYMTGFALFAERRFTFHGAPLDPRQVGYAFAWFGLLGIITQGLLIGRLVKHLGERMVVALGFSCCLLGYGLLAGVHTPLWIAVTGLFTSFGGSVLRPVLVSEIAGEVDARERGSVIGVNQSIQSLAQIVAPLIGTALIGAGKLSAWAAACSALCGLGCTLVALRIRHETTPAKQKVRYRPRL